MRPDAFVHDSDNEAVAHALRQAAEILQAQGANAFRVSAYRKAAANVEALPGRIRDVFQAQGREGLDAIPGVGAGIAAAIAEMLESGRWAQLERWRGTLEPALLFRTVPGIGPELAERIHDALGVDTLEALEVACHDGTLERVPGVGPRRTAIIRAALAEMLGGARLRRRQRPSVADEPAVELLLDVDRDYRDRAARQALPTIAPRRFNPAHEAWLPVLHATRGDWHVTALFSNTAQAHALGRTRDWVVLYFDGGDHAERQRTVVTELRGALAGRRVVRGREAECAAYYAGERSAAITSSSST
jgi:hypothetical protein